MSMWLMFTFQTHYVLLTSACRTLAPFTPVFSQFSGANLALGQDQQALILSQCRLNEECATVKTVLARGNSSLI